MRGRGDVCVSFEEKATGEVKGDCMVPGEIKRSRDLEEGGGAGPSS